MGGYINLFGPTFHYCLLATAATRSGGAGCVPGREGRERERVAVGHYGRPETARVYELETKRREWRVRDVLRRRCRAETTAPELSFRQLVLRSPVAKPELGPSPWLRRAFSVRASFGHIPPHHFTPHDLSHCVYFLDTPCPHYAITVHLSLSGLHSAQPRRRFVALIVPNAPC